MVRVGGGWADLAEYLKTYAEHHGHRAVSDGRVEVLGLGNDRVITPTASSSNGRSSALGMRSESRMEGRSESRLGMRSDSRQGNHPRRSSLISSIGYPSINTTNKDMTSTPTPGADIDSEAATPTSAVPTPTTATSQRRISGLWDTESLSAGLMGPAAAKKNQTMEMSNEKKEWVESVVEQAKKVGRKGIEFGDLGKKGGTRRVFMKGRVASGAGSIGGTGGEARERE